MTFWKPDLLASSGEKAPTLKGPPEQVLSLPEKGSELLLWEPLRSSYLVRFVSKGPPR